jgi:HAAS
MNTDKRASELIERYLYAVAEELPRDSRDDVVRELRTLIEDKLEDRAEALQKPVDEALVTYVIQELGAPRTVARRFDPRPEYLIGARFYPAFMKFLKIGLAGLAGLVVLSTVLGRISSPAGIFTGATLWNIVRMYFQMAIMLFGEAVIVLAILERTSVGKKLGSKSWDPRDLPELPEGDEDRISVAGLAVEICLIVFVACVLNFAPDWVGIFGVNDGGHAWVIKFTDLGIYLPVLAIDLWLALSIAVKFAVIVQRHWTTVTRWLEIGQGIVFAGIMFVIASRSSLRAPTGSPQIGPLMPLLGVALSIAPYAALIPPILHAVRMLRGRPQLARAK